jgi:hypothetical protein
MVLRTLVVWVLLAAVGVTNGMIRGALLVPMLGDQPAHVLSTFILCVLVFVVAFIFIRWIGPSTAQKALMIGLLWAALTVLFEFVAGHYAFGNSWEKLLADYNIWQGRIWLLVPIVLCLAPLWTFRVRRMKTSHRAA